MQFVFEIPSGSYV